LPQFNRLQNTLQNTLKETNFALLGLCLLLSAFGTLMVHSATLRKVAEDGFLFRGTLIMIVAVTLGAISCILISYIDYEAILKLWPLVAIVSVGLMVALFRFGGDGGSGRGDVISWIEIGGIYFQPSELVKVGFIITFAMHLTAVSDKINQLKNILLLGVHGMIPIGLVILTGDLGSALVFVAIFAGMLFISGVHLRYFGAIFILLGALSPILWLRFFSKFQKNRFLAVYYPAVMKEDVYRDVIYQQQQGINAIGSGQFFGKGLFQGDYTQSGGVPVNESDMIFTVIGEELGFAGCIVTLLFLAAVIVCCVLVARKSRDMTGNLLCYGVAIMVGAQTIINIGVCLKLLPCIGITLPFISAGGSANLCIYLAVGLVMSVYRFNKERQPVDFRVSRIYTPFS